MAPERYDNDRPKKSWSEIDKARDKSAHRAEGAGGSHSEERLQRSQAYRNYKTQLNKLFDGGALPEALKSKLDEAGVGADAKRKKAAEQAILAATKPSEVRAALEAHKGDHGFPDNEEVLGKLLDLEDAAVALEAITTIARLHAEGGLKRASSLRARLKTAQMTIDSAKVQQAARDLLAKL